MRRRKTVIFVLASGLAWLLLSGVSASQEQLPIVKKITLVGNRTTGSVIRRHLPFSEGDALGPGGLEEARQALFDMRHFKSVEVSSSAYEGGAEVVVKVEDGWYAIPFPFYASGSGGGRGGLFLMSRNVLREAESLFAMGMFGSSGGRGTLMAAWEGWSFQASYGRLDVVERSYRDGSFSSTSGFKEPPDEEDPSKYGTVGNSYKETVEEGTFALGFPLKRAKRDNGGISGRVGFKPATVHYSDALVAKPGGDGRIGEVFAGVQFGSGEGGGSGGGFGDGFGVILGYGLADLENRLKPLPKPKRQLGLGFTIHRGDSWTGSDFKYTVATADLGYSVAWGRHNNVTFSLRGGHGESLPFARLLATGPELGLRGMYAREQRGETAAGAGLSYSRPFRTTRRGVWQGSVFIEGAGTWDGGKPRDKEGVGFSFFYRFWRFPLPFGFSYTYCIDDKDSQVSGAVGGRF